MNADLRGGAQETAPHRRTSDDEGNFPLASFEEIMENYPSENNDTLEYTNVAEQRQQNTQTAHKGELSEVRPKNTKRNEVKS